MPGHDVSYSFDDWEAYTPQIDQGVTTNIAKTTTVARWMTIGPLAFVACQFTFTGTGTSGSDITVAFPTGVTAVNAGSIILRGTGVYNDGGVMYRLEVECTDKFYFWAANVTANARLGNNPTLAIANGDILGFSANYEIAV